MSGYEYLSFKEYEATVLSVGAGLRKLGLVKDDRVHLFATTSVHWLSIAHGSMSQSMPIVTAYDTLGVEGLRHSLTQTKARAIFLEPQLLKTLLESLGDLNHIEYVIYNTDGDTELSLSSIKELKKSHNHLTLLSYEELVDLGRSYPIKAVCHLKLKIFAASFGVPSVWETVKKGVIANVNKGGPVIRSVFWSAFYTKRFLSRSGLPGSNLLDTIVFNKVKRATGGRLRFCLNVWGAICDPLSFNLQVGDIPACIEIKLVDFPEAGYFSTNSPPQGEIWIRGPSVMCEYYDNIAETREALTPDRKNLVKTINGEYIALEKLESVYRAATVVANICIYVSSSETHPSPSSFPRSPPSRNSPSPLELIVMVLMIREEGRVGGMEIIQGVVLADEEWTTVNKLVTATTKLNRKAIFEMYRKDIDGVYGK
ncbi:hypothetical protein DID88_002861 [Monilinia fructigena]|uniref:AMP-dependent synthetase/ligase domain-containing protein n=1 Tax=Monilinia fructigena TaxID=38457 RepID=A0A395IQC0_9HELO|nr:hypothetical protein DID88_002861 [Monilinia fructigena]